jgi:hypothetical protein
MYLQYGSLYLILTRPKFAVQNALLFIKYQIPERRRNAPYYAPLLLWFTKREISGPLLSFSNVNGV